MGGKGKEAISAPGQGNIKGKGLKQAPCPGRWAKSPSTLKEKR